MTSDLGVLSVKRREKPLPVQARDRLIELITSGYFPRGSQLPSEQDLANALGVSRASVREAFRILEEDGWINRRQGVGTFVVENLPPLIRQNVESLASITRIIQDAGFIPGQIDLRVATTTCDEYVADKLQIEPGATVVVVRRIRTANNVPVAFSHAFVPGAIVRRIDPLLNLTGSLLCCLEEEYGQKIVHATAEILPVTAEEALARDLQTQPNSLLLLLDQVQYTKNMVPVLYSRDYFRTDRFRFHVIRSFSRQIISIQGVPHERFSDGG